MQYKTFYFHLSLSREQCLGYYEGQIKAIMVQDIYGKKIQFPSSAIRSHVTQVGINGQFRLTVDENNKFISLEKIL